MGQRTDGPAAVRRPRRADRVIATVVAVAVAVAVAVLVLYSPFEWSTAEDDRLKIGLRYPRGWSIDHFQNDLGLVVHTGVLVSNVDHELRYPDLPSGSSTSAWDMRDLPQNAVVVEVSRAPRFSVPCEETSPFPLPPSIAAPAGHEPLYGAPPYYFVTVCVDGRLPVNVFVYAFPHVDPVDLVRGWEVVASITPSGR